ncbi:MAG: hypothetical protein ACRBBN_01940 [Methyloligellaceae bacterium]
MSKKTLRNIPSLNGNYYHNGKGQTQSTRNFGKSLPAILTALIWTGIAGSPALAQDKYHDTETITPKYHSGTMVLPCSTFYCRLQRLMRLLERLEVEFYFGFELDLKIRLRPEEVERRLSLIEEKLMQRGQMVPEIKLELDALKVMISKG